MGALAGAFLAPFLYGLYLRRATLASAWVSFAFGVGVMTLNLFAPQVFPSWLQSPIHCGAFAMLAGLVIVPVVSLFTPKPDRSIVDHAFAGYDREVIVSARESLGDDASRR